MGTDTKIYTLGQGASLMEHSYQNIGYYCVYAGYLPYNRSAATFPIVLVKPSPDLRAIKGSADIIEDVASQLIVKTVTSLAWCFINFTGNFRH